MKDNKFELEVNKYVVYLLLFCMGIGVIMVIVFLSWMVIEFWKMLLNIMMLGASG